MIPTTLDPIRGPELPPLAQRRHDADAAAQHFEEIFVQQMVAEMRKSQLDGEAGGLFGKGPGSDTYASWFDGHMTKHIAHEGRVGLRDSLMREFERLGQIPSAKEVAAEAAALTTPSKEQIDVRA